MQRLSIKPWRTHVVSFMWIKHLLEKLKFDMKLPMTMHCDNQAAIHITSNPMFHERTKHIEVDCHITREKVEDGLIAPPYVSTRVQIADMFTNSFGFIMQQAEIV